MTESIRRRIIEQLVRDRTGSAPGLSVLLGVTKADVQYHLRKMLAVGEVENIPGTKSGGKGRPEKIYQIAADRRAGNYQNLAAILLELLDQTSTGFADEQDFVKRLAELFCGDVAAEGGPVRRLKTMIGLLNERGYQASWEAYRSGPRVIFQNCPYAGIIEKHILLCNMDIAILQILLGNRMVQTQKMNCQAGRVGNCVFQVQMKD